MAKKPSSSEPAPGALVQQPHGGALRHGSQPGTNAGGSGRPPHALRGILRGVLEDGIGTLQRILGGEVVLRIRRVCEHCGKEPTKQGKEEVKRIVPTVDQMLRAIEISARHGLAQLVSIDDVRQSLLETQATIRELLPQEKADELLQRIAPHWRKL